MKLTNKTWTLLIGKGESSNNSRNIFVLKRHYDKWESLKKDHLGNYYLTSILRAIYSLNALAGGRSALTKKITLQGAEIHYQIDSDGDVLIHGLVIDTNIDSGNLLQATGLYPVKYNSAKGWNTNQSSTTAMKLNHKWNNSHYAAVSGKFENKEEAGKKLIEHINHAYKAAVSKSESHTEDNHYSLYWQQDKHKSDVNRDHIVSLVQQAQERKASVSWLIHGEGAGTFASALKVLESHPSLSRFEAKDEEIVRNLRNATAGQKVFFSNPRGKNTSQLELEELCKKVGLTYIGSNINPYDLINADARKNASKQAVDLGGKLALGGIGALGGTNVLKSFDLATNASSTFAAAGLLLAGYIVGKSSLSTLGGYARSLPGAWSNTLGKGNQNWA